MEINEERFKYLCKKVNIIGIVIIILCGLLWMINSYNTSNTKSIVLVVDELIEIIKRQDMCDVTEELIKPNGYATSSFFCVWTANRTAEEIAGTEVHEQCHILIQKEFDHFVTEPYGNYLIDYLEKYKKRDNND